MAYVAVKGGQKAIQNSINLMEYNRKKGSSVLLETEQIKDQLFFLIDRIMCEGSLYAPDLAAVAIKQTCGDILEASFVLRAYRATKSRVGYSIAHKTDKMRVIRRISASFKEVPGGQILGASLDYTLRLLDYDLVKEDDFDREAMLGQLFPDLNGADYPDIFPKIVDLLKKEKLIEIKPLDHFQQEQEPFDITRESIQFPASRSAVLQTMARGETGGMLLLAYSNMRGFGMVHPVIGELRVGYLPVEIEHPYEKSIYRVGEIKVTEAEIISATFSSEPSSIPKFSLGYGLCFGHNETKAISMAVLDRAMQTSQPKSASEDQEFVLSHIDGIESVGFCNHYKLPHYVSFQSALDRVRFAQDKKKKESPE